MYIGLEPCGTFWRSMDLDIKTVTWIVGLLISNIGVLVGFFVSLKVSISILDERSVKQAKDIDNIGQILRDLRRELINKS